MCLRDRFVWPNIFLSKVHQKSVLQNIYQYISTLGFVRRNIQNCPVQTRRAAYLALVRSSLEYASAVWDPHIQQDIDKLERVQRRAARFISKDFRSKQKGCVTKMLQTHNLPTLQQRIQDIRLTMFFKIANGTLPGLPPADYVTKVVDKRSA